MSDPISPGPNGIQCSSPHTVGTPFTIEFAVDNVSTEDVEIRYHIWTTTSGTGSVTVDMDVPSGYSNSSTNGTPYHELLLSPGSGVIGAGSTQDLVINATSENTGVVTINVQALTLNQTVTFTAVDVTIQPA
jgi:hypothetical protein